MRRPSDKPIAMMRVVQHGLSPSTAYDAEQVARFAIGSEVEVTFSQARSDKQMRLFWVVLGKVVECTDYPNAEALAKALKIATKHVDSVSLIGGGLHVEPKSMRDMDREEFSRFFDAAMLVLATDVIPGLDVDALIREGRISVGDDA